MSGSVEHLVRPNIRSLKPYHSARQDHRSGILLDANENAFGSSASMDGIALNRYPDPAQRELRKRLAEVNGVRPEEVFAGVGSDEAIDLAMRIFCEPGVDNVVVPVPTYGMYAVSAAIQNVEVRACLLTDAFQLDRAAIDARRDERTKLLFCCSPNNPTGNLLRTEDLLALCDLDAVVVVDQAYVEFASSGSLIGEAAQRKNLIVLRTLSKAWGLAAIRCGYAVAHPSIVEWFLKVKSPYNLNALTSRVALEALRDPVRMEEVVHRIRDERTWLAKELAAVPCIRRVFPSDANFLLVHCAEASRICRELAAEGIIIRDRTTDPKLAECLRITVGTRPQNELLIATLRRLQP
jgi:histidinol-phosphate aminotransferase